MFDIETAKSKEDLDDDKKLDTLSAKLRVALMKTLRGQNVKEIQHEDSKLKQGVNDDLKLTLLNKKKDSQIVSRWIDKIKNFDNFRC